MIKVDLITGFLGAGKTTFLKKYVEFLMSKGQSVGIIENDYGAVNVDMMLLQDVQGELCDIETVAGGCDFDCHKRRFKSKLIAMGMRGYNRVIVEPSGLFDVDEFFDVLCEDPLDRWYEKGNVIAIVDALLENELSKNSEYMLASQVANAGVILISKSQLANDNQIKNTIEHINNSMKKIKCNRTFAENEIICKDWNNFCGEDFEKILNSNYKLENYVKTLNENNSRYNSLYYMNLEMSCENLKTKIPQIFNDVSCGEIFRIKGFLKNDDKWIEINATKKEINFKEIVNGQNIIIVIGENLNDDVIKQYFEK